MIDTLMVISKGGIPLFDFDKELGSSLESDSMVIQSSFFTAMHSFSQDIGADELRYIVFDKRTYLLAKAEELLVVFGKNGSINLSEIPDLDTKLLSTVKYLKESLRSQGWSGEEYPTEVQLNNLYQNLGEYLFNNELLRYKPNVSNRRSQKAIKKALFKSVGYEPGKCNIGPAERQRRLNYGILWVAIGLIGGLLMVNYLPSDPIFRLLRLILILPFFIGFQGFFQYFFKFCVTNAFSKRYNMN